MGRRKPTNSHFRKVNVMLSFKISDQVHEKVQYLPKICFLHLMNKCIFLGAKEKTGGSKTETIQPSILSLIMQ